MRIRDVLRGHTDTRYDDKYDPSYLVNPGDLLVGMDGDFNCAPWRGEPALLNQRVCKVVADERYYSSRFLKYVLQGYLSAIQARTPSMTVTHLSSRTVADIPLPLPCRAEQDRVADFLDEKLDDVKSAFTALERVQRNLKRYRAAVLEAAAQGRLVPTEAELARAEGRTYEPASELLKRILAQRRRRWEDATRARVKRTGKALIADEWRKGYAEPVGPDTDSLPAPPQGWCHVTLRQLKEFSLYGPRFSSDAYTSDGPLVLRTSDISEAGKVNLESAPRISISNADLEAYRVQKGDVLITRTGSIGTLAVFDDAVDAIPGAYLIQYRLAAPAETSWFVFTVLKAPSGQRTLTRGAAGVGRPNLNAPTIEHIPIAMPPLAEQARILLEVSHLLSLSDALEVELFPSASDWSASASPS